MLDAVHGYIHIPDWAKKIIDTPLFQRLNFVKQLTSAHYVFPGAVHTRKSHSIGAMHIGGKYIKSILSSPRTGLQLTEEEKEHMIRHVMFAALLHDIAHLFYSHSGDATVYSKMYREHKGHDVHRHTLLPFFEKLFPVNYFDIEYISDIWNGKIPYLSALISGVCGSDRGDFLKRDSYFCGINYGIFDMDRIITNSYFDINGKGEIVLVYDSKIVPSILQGLSSRLYLYSEIYLHKNVISASILIELMISEAGKVFDYVERTKDIDQFIYMNDGSAFHEILFSTDPRLSLAREYAKALYERRLPKMISEERKIFRNDLCENVISGIVLLDEKHVKWTSRVLSKDFVSEFEESHIHISKNNQLYPFADYAAQFHLENSKESYYFERIYQI
jgi:HD superfamily phosphohydrolase